MRNLLLATTCVCLLGALTAACGEDSSSRLQAPNTITGRERIAWDQQAPDAEELSRYSYVLYVDGIPVLLPGATCGALAGQVPAAPCSSPLPPLQRGQHTLELATRVTDSGTVLESARSAPLIVTVAGSVGTSLSSATASATAGELRWPDAAPYVVEQVVAGLDRPSALAQLPDGRLLVAESGGRIRITEGGRLADQPAAELTDADSAQDASVSLAVASDFASTRRVYVGYVARDASGARVGRVVRFREVGGTLGEAAVLVDGLPADAGTPRVRFGPDGALYVGTPASDAGDAANVGSFAGKILRFTPAGAAHPENPFGLSPVFSSGHPGRIDFDWEPETGTMWVAEPGEGGLTVRRLTATRKPGSRLRLEGVDAVGIAFLAGESPEQWRGSLFVAAPAGECLLRIVAPGETRDDQAVERLFSGQFGRISAIVSGADGLYFATANGAAGTVPADAVYRIRSRKAARHPV